MLIASSRVVAQASRWIRKSSDVSTSLFATVLNRYWTPFIAITILFQFFSTIVALAVAANAAILQNGQVRETHFLDTRIDNFGNGWNSTA